MSRMKMTAPRLLSVRSLLACFAVMSFVLVSLVSIAPQASAVPNFKAPWSCSVGWHASTYATHGAAVDFNNLADGSDAGKPVLASASGTATTVAGHTTLGNYVDIDHGGGWVTRYAHLVAVPSIVDRNGSQSGIQVNQGDHIGNVGSTGDSSAPHLHFEQRYNGAKQVVAFDGVTIPVGTSYTTADPVHTSTNCSSGGSSPTEPRIGVLNDEGELSVKAGPLNAMWFHVSSATSFKMSPNRIAVLDADGDLAVKEGPLNAIWVEMTSDVSSFDVTDTRVGVMYPNGQLHVKEGPLGATWSHVGDGASFKMSPNRIALLSSSGVLSVKEGPLNATWVTVASGVSSFEVTDNRIGIINTSGQLHVKEGPLGATWSHITSAVSFKMSPNRIAVLGNSGALVVKEGPLNATWTTVSTGVSSFDVTNSRIVIRDSSGVVSVKEGPLNAVWSQISSGASAVELN